MFSENKKPCEDKVDDLEKKPDLKDENPDKNTENNEEDGKEKSFESDSNEAKVEGEENSDKEELEKKFLRLQADFSNYKKRVEKEKLDIYKSAGSRLISNLLPVIDDFERAISHVDESSKEAFKDGINLIMKSLNEVLVKEGLEYIDVKDADFDPNLHYAVMTEEVEGIEPGKIIVEVQKGYKVSGKVIRPSMVKVSK